MEAKKEDNSGNKADNKVNAERLRKKNLLRDIDELPEQDAKDQLFTLRNAIFEKDSEIKSLKEEIERLKMKEEIKDIYAGYKTEASYTDKIVFVFRKYSKVMTTKELKEELLKCEPILAQAWIDPLKSVSEIVYRAVKLKCVIRYNKAGVHGFTYGLPEWFDDNNKLIRKYIR